MTMKYDYARQSEIRVEAVARIDRYVELHADARDIQTTLTAKGCPLTIAVYDGQAAKCLAEIEFQAARLDVVGMRAWADDRRAHVRRKERESRREREDIRRAAKEAEKQGRGLGL